jgi:hypothetical protein
MKFYREVQNYMQLFKCQYRVKHISKRNYEISKVHKIHISRLELQSSSLAFFISFSKVYVWDLGMRSG